MLWCRVISFKYFWKLFLLWLNLSMAETVGKIEVVIKGGKPWGFRLQSISENRSTITITEILPGGKADLHGKLKVGDNIIKINGIQCLSLEDALQLIESAFRTLTILVWRGSNCSEAIVSYGNQISKPFLAQPFSTQNGNGSAFSDSYDVESSPIYENLQDLSHEKVQNDTNFYHGHSLENSFQYSNSKNVLVTLLDNNSSGSISVKKHVRDSSHFSPLASSNSHIPNYNIKWKKQSSPQNVELNHSAGIKLATGVCTQFNYVNLRENLKKEKKLSGVECDSMGVDTQLINKQVKKRNSMSTWTEKNGCVYPNCQNASQTCTKHSPPERDFVKLNFKQILLNEPTQSSFLKVNNEKLLSPICNSNKSKKDIDYHSGIDSSSMKNCATVNSSITTSNAELNKKNIYSNISYLNSFSQNNLNENICNLSDKINRQTISQNCVAGNPNTSSSRNIKESSFSNTFSSNKNLLSTNMMNELNQKSLYTNQIYSNVTYSNLKSNIQLRKNNFSDISYQNITNKENLDLISTSQISDNIKIATKNVDEKIVNKETNTCIDRSFSSRVPSFSKCAKLKNLITSDFAVGEKCLQRDNLVYKKNNPVVSRYENIPIQFHSVSKSSKVKADMDEKSTNNLPSFENSVSRFSDSLKESELLRVYSNPSDVSFLDPENNERAFSDDESNVMTSSNPNYENIPFVSTSIPEISINDMQQEKNLVEYKATSFDLQKNNFMDKTLYMIYNKSSISTSVFKYSTICSENNQNNMDQDLQLLNIHKYPEASLVMEGRQTPPLPSPPPETETEIFESDEPLPPPPPQFPRDFNQEFQNDSQVVQAVYANIEMLKVQCSLVSSATQTTLQRKDNSRMKDFPHLQIAPQQSITMEDQESHPQKNNCEVSTQVQNYQKPKKNSLNLPLTSPYFTTSVPKAKLLTQHTSKFEEKNFHIDNELSSEKEVLIDSITKKLQILKQEKDALEEELKQNEELGKSLTTKLEKLATETETQKFKLYVEELEKITNLLLSLSGRLARTENALLILPSGSSEEKEVLQDKYKKLSQQYDEAVHLQDNIEKRNKHVSLFLCKYFSRDELIDYDHFVHMKVKLLVDYKDLIEKIKLGEEQLYTLKGSFNAEDCNEFKSMIK